MNILVIGGGGREHAIVAALAKSPKATKIYAIPGNPGMADLAECCNLNIEDNECLVQFALEHTVDLTVVGPEVPLSNGVVDAFQAKGIKIFGPTQAAAQIEASKSFAKDLMKKYSIPTAAYEVFTDLDAAKKYVAKSGVPIVIKADGLAAGKGVVVAMTLAEANEALDSMLGGQMFGQAGCQVVIEECLIGEEASLLAFTDGKTCVPMVAAQDHKRAYDGDQGPNTGGMGTYAPAPVLTQSLRKQVEAEILEPVLAAMAKEGCPYQGCLYAGLMITDKGPKVIEFNARFGDPETQVVLPLLDSDFVTIIEHCVDGTLKAEDVSWKNEAAVCVVLASGGYPGSYEKGKVISGLDNLPQGVTAYHAGTALQNGQVVTSGGRVLGVTAIDSSMKAAIDKAYAGVQCIQFEDMHYRKDIAHRVLARLEAK